MRETEYQYAQYLLKNKDYESALSGFTYIGEYKDSETMVSEVKYQQALSYVEEENYSLAYYAFVELGDYCDSATQLANVQALLYEKAQTHYAAKEYDETVAIYTKLGAYEDSENLSVQATADQLYQNGDIAGAKALYDTLDASYHTYADEDSALQTTYDNAIASRTAGNYDEAYTVFVALGAYSDASTQATETLYQKANHQASTGLFDDAIATYTSLGEYSDSVNLSAQTSADALFASGNYAGAYNIYATLDESYFTHKAEYEALYTSASTERTNGNYDEAYNAFVALGAYSDASTQANESLYQKGQALQSEGKLKEAEEVYTLIPTYEGIDQTIDTLRIEIAENAIAQKNYAEALSYFLLAEQTDAVKQSIYTLAQTAYDAKTFAVATKAYQALGAYELSISKLPIAHYAWANQLFENTKFLEAKAQFELLGSDYTDVADRIVECDYQYANAIMTSGDYATAQGLFADLADYKDSDTKRKECIYQQAKLAQNNADYSAAETLYDSIQGYKDSTTQHKACIYAQAEAYNTNGDYLAAASRYAEIADYLDSATKTLTATKTEADKLFNAGDYAGAETIYANIKTHENSESQYKECRLRQGKALIAIEDYTGALVFVENLAHGDSEILAAQCYDALAYQTLSTGDVEKAVRLYAKALIYPGVQETLFGMAKDFASTNQNKQAIETLWALGDYAPAKELLAELATSLSQNDNLADALVAYCVLEEDANITALMYNSTTAQLQDTLASYTIFSQGDFSKQVQYGYAKALLVSGNATEAYSIFLSIADYKDFDDLLATDENLQAVAATATAAARALYMEIGNIITYGHYEQDGNTSNGKEPIEWIVVDYNETTAESTLVAKWLLDDQEYHDYTPYPTWAKSDIRAWLNDAFLHDAFTNEEQKAIIKSNISTPDYWRHEGGADTEDYIYLLSREEAMQYFPTEKSRMAAPTPYAVDMGGSQSDDYFVDGEGCGWWWLRSPSHGSNSASYVSADGSIGLDFVIFGGGIRPAFKLHLDSLIF